MKVTVRMSNNSNWFFGYSLSNDSNNVLFWQESNIIKIPEGVFFVFVKNKNSGRTHFKSKQINCLDTCHVVINSVKLKKPIVHSVRINSVTLGGESFLQGVTISKVTSGEKQVLVQLPKLIVSGATTDTKNRVLSKVVNGIEYFSNGVQLRLNDVFSSELPFKISTDETLLTDANFVFFGIKAVTNRGNSNEGLISGSIVNINSEVHDLVIEETYTKGLTGDVNYQIDSDGSKWYYPASKNFWTQMSVNFVSNQNKITMNIDTAGWGEGAIAGSYLLFKLDIDPNWITQAQLEAIDFSAMKGLNVSIFGALFKLDGTIMDTRQSEIHFAGDANTDVPSFFKQNPNKRINTPTLFPEFSLPSQLNINNQGTLASDFSFENHLNLKRGYDVITSKGNPHASITNKKLMYSDYDRWAYDNGCPETIQGGADQTVNAVNWLAGKPMWQLQQYFNPVIQNAKGHHSAFLDMEAFNVALYANQIAMNKLASLFRAFKIANPDVLLTTYIGAKPVSYVYNSTINFADALIENNKYNQEYIDLVNQGFFSHEIAYVDLSSTYTLTGEQGRLSDSLGLGIVGDYEHRINDTTEYAYIQECEIVNKLFTDKKFVSLYWSYIETLPNEDPKDISFIRRYYRKLNGFVYFHDYKPSVPSCVMFNRIVIANFFLKNGGMWLWHNPQNSVEGYENHSDTGKYGDDLDVNDRPPKYPYILGSQPNQLSINNGVSEVSSTVNHNYAQLGLFLLSLNNEFLNSAIEFASFSTNAGVFFYEQEDLKPAFAEFKKLPIVRIKKHPTQSKWLIFAMNKHLQSYQTQTIIVRVTATKTQEITIKGKYCTIKRVKLQ